MQCPNNKSNVQHHPSTRAHIACHSAGGKSPYGAWSPLAEVVCVKRCGRREAFASGGAGGRSGRRRLHFRVSAPGDTRSVVRRACHFRVRIDLYTQKALEDTFRSSGHSENRSSYFSAMDKKLYVTVFAHIAAWVPADFRVMIPTSGGALAACGRRLHRVAGVVCRSRLHLARVARGVCTSG